MRDEFADGHEDMDWASSTTLMILIEFSHLYKYVKICEIPVQQKTVEKGTICTRNNIKNAYRFIYKYLYIFFLLY